MRRTLGRARSPALNDDIPNLIATLRALLTFLMQRSDVFSISSSLDFLRANNNFVCVFISLTLRLFFSSVNLCSSCCESVGLGLTVSLRYRTSLNKLWIMPSLFPIWKSSFPSQFCISLTTWSHALDFLPSSVQNASYLMHSACRFLHLFRSLVFSRTESFKHPCNWPDVS